MNSFKIKNIEFGVGNIQFSVENHLLNLEITGDKNIFDELTEDDESEWAWALYAPNLYFHDVPYNNKIVVDNECLNQYEIALYMMRHNDFIGTLRLTDKAIRVYGKVDMMGEWLPVSVCIEISNL